MRHLTFLLLTLFSEITFSQETKFDTITVTVIINNISLTDNSKVNIEIILPHDTLSFSKQENSFLTPIRYFSDTTIEYCDIKFLIGRKEYLCKLIPFNWLNSKEWEVYFIDYNLFKRIKYRKKFSFIILSRPHTILGNVNPRRIEIDSGNVIDLGSVYYPTSIVPQYLTL